MNRPFTGRDMTWILVAGFAVVIAVNFLMARFAVTTFGGVVVKNSYVASQQFNDWLVQAERSRALGWEPEVGRRTDDRIAVEFGTTSGPQSVHGLARHPLGRRPDLAVSFAAKGAGQFISLAPLPKGRWILRLEGRDQGKVWRAEVGLQ